MLDSSAITMLFDVKETFFTVFEHPVSYVEFIGTVLGLISVFLAARANKFTWPTGIANAIFFLVIFYQIHLYSDMFLQMYFCGMGVYGWFSWKYKAEHEHSAIRTLTNSERLRLAGLIAAVVLLIGTLISQIHVLLPQVFDHPASFPYIDTFIAISSIGLYSVKGVKLIAVEFVIFLALAVLGIASWYRIWKKTDSPSAEAA